MSRSSYARYLLLALLIIILDQITKILVVRNFMQNEAVPVIGDLLNIRLIYNEGGALGTAFGPPWLYTILTLAALVLIVRYFVTSKPDGAAMKFSLAFILGGAIGNLVDRIAYGRVVDFIDMDIPDIPAIGLYRWYTYNIADAAISAGLVLFAISVFIPRKNEPDPVESDPLVGSPEMKGEST